MFKKHLTRPWIPVETRSARMEDRKRSADEYHTARWTRESKAYRQENPLCRKCDSVGLVRATEVTDHIIPPEVHGDFWDRSNWQPLCRRCNIEKGNHDKKLIQVNRNEKR